ncbi:MAG: hypothetical protein Q8899_01740 [Weeping tea tree witches'-broom phytoplasma]|uniref:hypothetical protein n=1 Tax=Candidatus Phytoplasma melaleucae TaxID=2982630 RepID=UPI00293AA2C3|nr:hypothetical protein [Weeping tea tree witches'-broom phytoplasma]
MSNLNQNERKDKFQKDKYTKRKNIHKRKKLSFMKIISIIIILFMLFTTIVLPIYYFIKK